MPFWNAISAAPATVWSLNVNENVAIWRAHCTWSQEMLYVMTTSVTNNILVSILQPGTRLSMVSLTPWLKKKQIWFYPSCSSTFAQCISRSLASVLYLLLWCRQLILQFYQQVLCLLGTFTSFPSGKMWDYIFIFTFRENIWWDLN